MKQKSQLDAKQKEMRRFRAIEAIEAGFSQSQAAGLVGASRTSVSKWLGRFNDSGRAGLRAQRPGRPPVRQMPPKHVERLRQLLLAHTPDQVGIRAFFWTWQTVKFLARERAGVDMSRWTVIRYLADWGIFVPRPFERYLAAQHRALLRWFSEDYRKIRSNARRINATIVFLEETVVSARTGGSQVPNANSSLRLWWLKGPRGEWAFVSAPHHADANNIVRFLVRSLRELGKPVVLITADEKYFRDKKVKDWLNEHEEEIRMELVSM